MTRPWETVDRVVTNEGPLELKKRGERDFLILFEGRVLMSSAAHRSEDALATLVCRELEGRPSPHVLVSGLGMGFTLRATLDGLGPGARVDVAELNAVVVDWCKGPLAALTRGAALDPRVDLEVVDVTTKIAGAARGSQASRYDAILLDLYEGPQSSVPARHPLYGAQALSRTRDALREAGVLGVWCEAPSQGFERALSAARLSFKLHRAGRGGSVHFVYVAKLAPIRSS